MIAVAVAVAFAPALKRRLWRHALPLFMTVGLLLIWLHGLLDLPFRCPAIMYSWAVMLAAAGCLGRGIPSALQQQTPCRLVRQPHDGAGRVNGFH